MSYAIEIKPRALKKLGKTSEPYKSRIISAIKDLAEDPRPDGCKKLAGREQYRIRVNDFRVIYHIFDGRLIVEVLDICKREDAY